MGTTKLRNFSQYTKISSVLVELISTWKRPPMSTLSTLETSESKDSTWSGSIAKAEGSLLTECSILWKRNPFIDNKSSEITYLFTTNESRSFSQIDHYIIICSNNFNQSEVKRRNQNSPFQIWKTVKCISPTDHFHSQMTQFSKPFHLVRR